MLLCILPSNRIGYLTGAILLVAGASTLLAKKMSDPSTAVKVEGINYFADTLLFAGAILGLASTTPSAD